MEDETTRNQNLYLIRNYNSRLLNKLIEPVPIPWTFKFAGAIIGIYGLISNERLLTGLGATAYTIGDVFQTIQQKQNDEITRFEIIRLKENLVTLLNEIDKKADASQPSDISKSTHN